MSGAGDEDDVLAAEYALGVLEGAERAAAAARSERDAAFAAAIADWEQRLSPLARLVAESPAPESLWPRIVESCGLSPVPLAEPRAGAARRPSLLDRLGFWRGATATGFALAAAMAVIVLLRGPPAPLMPPVPLASAVMVPPAGGAPAWLVAAGSDKTLSLRPLQHIAVSDAQSLELWMLPDGAKVPRPVSLLRVTGDRVTLPAAARGPMELMISLEQKGGSPTGLPKGPVLWQGHLPAFVISG
ncbi:anti-sigma factor [Acidisoma sp. C75]